MATEQRGCGERPNRTATDVKPLKLDVLGDHYAVCRLDASAPLPGWTAGELSSLTRTPEELSVVCRSAAVPEGVRAETSWRCLRVQGPLEFSQIGVIASLTAPLAAAEIGVFVISTYDTDYLLVKEEDLERTVATLRAAGHEVLVDGQDA